jgi:oxygen-independent coproporphyrinogen-3 oxidase
VFLFERRIKMEKAISLYIHIPFCRQKCLYCDFPSFAGKENWMLDYTKALCKEIESKADKKIRTIFIGGGTPTYLSLECLELLKESIDKLCKTQDVEFTIEGNPDSFSREKLEVFKRMGVNRLSIGLQAWQDKLLKNIGRIHSLEQFLFSFNNARELGFKNINVDLMFGLPDQTLENWKETLENIVELEVEHISCYSLIVEENTVFYKMNLESMLTVPSEEIERQMYEYAVNFLKKKYFNQYEISNFSRKDFECRHNLTYWNLNEYIACGSGSHSYIGGIRYRNEEDIEKYVQMIREKGTSVIEEHKNSQEDEMEEFMFMGLRKIEGISEVEFKNRFKISIDEIYKDIINKFLNVNLLVRNNSRIYLTEKGIELSNQVMCEFIL